MPITIRRSLDRGYFNYEWLKTLLTFSFGEYEDPKQMGFRSLRVLNENVVKPGVGFPLHANQNVEIISIVLKGGLAHQDELGNGSILYPGYVQLLSTGTGVAHSELNASDKESVHFLEIWILPNVKNLQPSYQEASFSDEAKYNQWCLIASPDGRENSLKVHQDVELYLANLTEGQSLTRQLAANRSGWLQVIKGDVELNDQQLDLGDGAAITEIEQLTVKALAPAQLLFIDLA